jgi:hypothetical protein
MDIKAVQSLWTRPLFSDNRASIETRLNGGWMEYKINLMSWALSCLLAKEHYKQIDLYTDELGYKLLIEYLDLPYDGVHLSLGELNNFNVELWSYGKIIAYKNQSRPFLHIDGDVFLFNKVDIARNDELVCQQLENFKFYEQLFELVDKQLIYKSELVGGILNSKVLKGYNCGIFGGTNLEFIQNYCNTSIDLYEKYSSINSKFDLTTLNIFFEQVLLYFLASGSSIKVKTLFGPGEIKEGYSELLDFLNLGGEKGYIHCVGHSKRNPVVNEQVLLLLYRNNPEIYKKIENIQIDDFL